LGGAAMQIAWIDFETRSECDIKRGAYNYALHHSTGVLCMTYAIDDGEVQLWLPGQPMPDFTGMQIRAHNAAFERLIFTYVLDQTYPLTSYYCTATQARANCLPGALEDAGRAISSRMRKDHRGKELVRKCCCPPFKHTEQDMQDLYDYCLQDVRAMRDISKSLRELSDEELHDYHVSERINDRGLLIDVDLCQAAMRYSAEETEEIQAIVKEVTEGEITSVRSPRMREWVLARVGEEAKKMMVVYKDGEKKYSIDKSVRANLLAFAEENPDEVPEDVAEVVACADDLWASSTAKFGKLASMADDEDKRLRGAFVFAGGAATGRFSSYGAQLHNFTRKCAKSPEDVRRAMVRGHRIVPEYGKRTTDVLRGMLRPALIPKTGYVFVVLDWAGIEARVNPWLSDSDLGRAKLDLFIRGDDVYKVNAAATFHVRKEDVTSEQRQIGKVQELSLGYLGGVGAFASMGRNYGVFIGEDEARKMVQGWRKANPWAMLYGSSIENAYRAAMRNPGKAIQVARTTYLYHGKHLWYSLPSGRVLCYPFARFEADGEVSYLKSAFKPAADAKEWPRARLWRGLAIENLTQAASADLLRNTLRIADSEGIRIVAHVHDEVVAEAPADAAEAVLARLKAVMVACPAWAQGLPLAVEGKLMERYGK
jgi:DNA polymerase